MRKSDRLLIASIVALAVYYVLAITIPEFASPILIVYNILLEISLGFGYFGPFIVSFIGNASFLFPMPYMLVTFIVGGFTDTVTGEFLFDPWIVGIVSGFGATLGEMTGYLIGFGGRRFIDENQRNSFSEYIKSHPRAIPLITWFLAVSPIADDFFIVPLGAAKYPWWKVAIPQFVGKSMFMIGAAFAGRFSLDFVEDIIGNPASITSRTIEVLALLSLVVSLYVLARVDWQKLMTKHTDIDVTHQ